MNILEYHAKYFEASAWLVLGINRFKVAKETGGAMGVAAGTANHAYQLFVNMGPIISAIPSDYGENYKKKLANAEQMAKTSTDKAKNVFFDAIPVHAKVPMPDSKNFVKFDDSCKEELNKTPVMNETLRHVIPPEVRTMQSEIKQFIQNTIDQKYKELEKQDTEERAFLGQYQLPQSFYELTSGSEIPESYTKRIEDF